VGSFAHRAAFLPPYIRILARRSGRPAPDGRGPVVLIQ
jgi:hypothetical protein